MRACEDLGPLVEHQRNHGGDAEKKIAFLGRDLLGHGVTNELTTDAQRMQRLGSWVWPEAAPVRRQQRGHSGKGASVTATSVAGASPSARVMVDTSHSSMRCERFFFHDSRSATAGVTMTLACSALCPVARKASSFANTASRKGRSSVSHRVSVAAAGFGHTWPG